MCAYACMYHVCMYVYMIREMKTHKNIKFRCMCMYIHDASKQNNKTTLCIRTCIHKHTYAYIFSYVKKATNLESAKKGEFGEHLYCIRMYACMYMHMYICIPMYVRALTDAYVSMYVRALTDAYVSVSVPNTFCICTYNTYIHMYAFVIF
jgi:hypothetical protein